MTPLIVSMSPVTSFNNYLMENQFPCFPFLWGFLPTDFGLCFALCITSSNVGNQLAVIITHPDVVN